MLATRELSDIGPFSNCSLSIKTVVITRSFSKPTLQAMLRIRRSASGSTLLNTIHPTTTGSIKVGKTTLSGLLKAPLGYGVSRADKNSGATGTVTLEVGNWFRATSMVVSSVSYTLSKEITSGGFPLYANVKVAFESYRVRTASEVQNFFRNTSSGSSRTAFGASGTVLTQST